MFGLVSAKRLKRANETIDRLQESIEIVKQDREVYFERCLQLKKENDGLRQRIEKLSGAYVTAAQFKVEMGDLCTMTTAQIGVRAAFAARRNGIAIDGVMHRNGKTVINKYPRHLLQEVAGI